MIFFWPKTKKGPTGQSQIGPSRTGLSQMGLTRTNPLAQVELAQVEHARADAASSFTEMSSGPRAVSRVRTLFGSWAFSARPSTACDLPLETWPLLRRGMATSDDLDPPICRIDGFPFFEWHEMQRLTRSKRTHNAEKTLVVTSNTTFEANPKVHAKHCSWSIHVEFAGDLTRTNGEQLRCGCASKLFFLLSRLLLFLPPRRGLLPTCRLQERLARFAEIESLCCRPWKHRCRESPPVAGNEGDMLTTLASRVSRASGLENLGCQGPVKQWKGTPLHLVTSRGSC